MNTFWSEDVQSSEILYFSRLARFNENNKSKWFDILQVKDNLNILELGCGPGHFCNMIKANFPNCKVTGIDLDKNHINFAKNMAKNLNLDINYMVEDTCSLPFKDNQFDLIFSHTLVEHLPFDKFISEQKRILKENGTLIFIHVDSKRKHINQFDYLKKEIDEIYEKLEYKNNNIKVGQYLLKPEEYLNQLNIIGFKNLCVKFEHIAFYFPDLCNNINEGIKQIEALHISDTYNAKFNIHISKNGENYEEKLLGLIDQKYSERKRLYLENKPIFDYESTAINIFTATK